MNFRRRPFLCTTCTTLYRNPMQVSNFGGTFDQPFLLIFCEIFTEDSSPLLLYHGAKTSKMTKNSNQGGPALNRYVGTFAIGPQLKGSVEWSRHERHFCSLLPYFLLSWLKIFPLCLSFCTSSPDLVLFKKFLQEKEKHPKNLPKRLSS